MSLQNNIGTKIVENINIFSLYLKFSLFYHQKIVKQVIKGPLCVQYWTFSCNVEPLSL